ncbi:MAG: GNAT family N-acetyltransferase [Allomuricauda sp.]
MIPKVTGPEIGDLKTCEDILRSLPEWFGIEEAIVALSKESTELPTFYARADEQPIGILTIKKHFPESAEIHLIAVRKIWHRKGIGKLLLKAAENWLSESKVKILQVKTLGESRESKEYERTRFFYEKMGFTKIEELYDFWPQGNPCLIMVKNLDKA